MNCLVIRDIFLHRSLFSEAVQVLPAAPSAGLCVSAFIFVFNNSTALRTSGWLAYGRKPHFMPWETLGLLCAVWFARYPRALWSSVWMWAESSAHCFGHISSELAPGSHACPYHHAASAIVSVTSLLQLAVNFMKLFPACRLRQWHATSFKVFLAWLHFVMFVYESDKILFQHFE